MPHDQRTIADSGAAAAAARSRQARHLHQLRRARTAAVARGQAATRAAMVLSDLFARADARAGELAKAYDRARIAGLACEASYNALIN